ncbi:MAG TPA: DinB family protein [Bryobacteraceae bacterium]|nr:DinB family protein [Bryobacteraceae bacterium]
MSLPEGIFQGFDGEWNYLSRRLLTLAEAIPAEKFAWRPSPGVRSISEVCVHILVTNFYLLSTVGPAVPPEIPAAPEQTLTAKADVIEWLTRSLDAVKSAHAAADPAGLQRTIDVFNVCQGTADAVYLRIIVHANEHLGHLIGYARMNGIAPPSLKE